MQGSGIKGLMMSNSIRCSVLSYVCEMQCIFALIGFRSTIVIQFSWLFIKSQRSRVVQTYTFRFSWLLQYNHYIFWLALDKKPTLKWPGHALFASIGFCSTIIICKGWLWGICQMKQRSSARRSGEKPVQRLKSHENAYKKPNNAKSEIMPAKKVNVWSEVSQPNHTIIGALKKHH